MMSREQLKIVSGPIAFPVPPLRVICGTGVGVRVVGAVMLVGAYSTLGDGGLDDDDWELSC